MSDEQEEQTQVVETPKKKRKYKNSKGTMLTVPDKRLPFDVPHNDLIRHINSLTALTCFMQERVVELVKESNNAKMSILSKPASREVLYGLASIGCTVEEIATVIGCDTSTIKKNEQYMEIINLGREETKMSLRRKQLEKATNNNGDTTMLIWLGKQLLGQKDVPNTQVNIQNNVDTSQLRDKLKQVLSIEPPTDATVVDVPSDGKNE